MENLRLLDYVQNIVSFKLTKLKKIKYLQKFTVLTSCVNFTFIHSAG